METGCNWTKPRVSNSSTTGFVHFSMTFQDFFHDLLKNSDLRLSNCPPVVMSKQSFILLKLYLIFGLISKFLNFGSYCLSFIESILIVHDFPWPTPKFQDFPGLENEIIKFHDFPGFPWPAWTLYKWQLTWKTSHNMIHGTKWFK